MTERDKILKTLRDVPGVEESLFPPYGPLPGDESCWHYETSHARVSLSEDDELWLDKKYCPLTLAEAVAALTPPAVPRKPTYQFVAGIRGAIARQSPCDFYCSSVALKTEDSVVMICFGKNDEIAKVYVNNSKFCESPEDYDPEISVLLATPTTEPEVLATLRMCRVEVGE